MYVHMVGHLDIWTSQNHSELLSAEVARQLYIACWVKPLYTRFLFSRQEFADAHFQLSIAATPL
jgi:hypothetical protein